jgi:hypothetical protein
MACHACGCAVVGEIKKERYVYYRCAGHADKCQGKPTPAGVNMCARRCLSTVHELLGRSRFDNEVLEWVCDALYAVMPTSGASMRRRSSAISSNARGFKTASMRCTSINSTVIDTSFYDRMSNRWRDELNRCQHEIDL